MRFLLLSFLHVTGQEFGVTDVDPATGEVTLQVLEPISPTELFAVLESDQEGSLSDEPVAAVSLTLTLDVPVGLDSSLCFTPIAAIALDDALIGFLAPGSSCFFFLACVSDSILEFCFGSLTCVFLLKSCCFCCCYVYIFNSSSSSLSLSLLV